MLPTAPRDRTPRLLRRCRHLRDLTATGFRNEWNRLTDMGSRLDGYEKPATSNGARYAGVWRQNSDRPTWSLRSKRGCR